VTQAGARTPDLEELLAYWQGELAAEREAEVEELVFADAQVAQRLDAVAGLAAAVAELVRRGRVTVAVTAEALERLQATGVAVRTYAVGPGQTVPCTIGSEEFVALRLGGAFEGVEQVDMEVAADLEGEAPRSDRVQAVPVDQRMGEVVLLYRGDAVRALPRCKFRYRVWRAGAVSAAPLAEFGLDHTPSGMAT
jgi:hypothetical protein